jgi:hypothetical protein
VFYIAGALPEDTDRMIVNGTAYLRGTLNLNFGFSTEGLDLLTSWPVVYYEGK